MECRLTRSNGPWRCQMFLRFERDINGKPMTPVKEVIFGDVLTDEKHLEDALRRAQLAILNPKVPYNKFINLNLADVQPDGSIPFAAERGLSFSPNVVCLHILSPHVTDLSFVDLPGKQACVHIVDQQANKTSYQVLYQTLV